MLKKGFTNYQLKMFALICMVFDHVHYMLAAQIGIPYWFGIIGRLSAPIFIFMTANGMAYTRSRFRYLFRLYAASVIMAVMNSIVNSYFPHPEGAMVINNIFATLFLVGFFIHVIEGLVKSIRAKSWWACAGYSVLTGLPFGLSILLLKAMALGYFQFFKVLFTFVPTPLMVEGGPIFILLGVGFYFVRCSKWKIGVFYSVFSFGLFALYASAGLTFENLFIINYQWLMWLALPLILAYNGKKGRSSKWFFYVFYPAHLYILLGVSRIL